MGLFDIVKEEKRGAVIGAARARTFGSCRGRTGRRLALWKRTQSGAVLAL